MTEHITANVHLRHHGHISASPNFWSDIWNLPVFAPKSKIRDVSTGATKTMSTIEQNQPLELIIHSLQAFI